MQTAWRLFYRDGFRAIGIDTVLAEAGVAKMTLYNHFGSKDELIVALIENQSTAVLEGVAAAVGQAGRSPKARLLAVFDWLEAFYARDDFRGCAFIRALSEFPEVEHPVHQAAWRHKQALTALLAELTAAAGAKDPQGTAEAMRLLIDGSLIAAHATKSTAPARQAKSAATLLLKLATT